MSPRPALRLAVLISGRGSNMVAIAQACRQKRIGATITVVISDQPDAAGLDRAREMGIEAVTVPRRSHLNREAFEDAMAEVIEAHGADVVILAGFMRVLSPKFVDRYVGRMLNIHPSLLPKYQGLHTYQRVLAAGDREHGASVHFVTAELDGGPLVLQSKVDVLEGDTEDSLSARVHVTEHIIYPKVIGLLADGRLACRDDRVWLDGVPLAQPLVEDFREASRRLRDKA